ncbi:MAG TPA: hypothetical protein PLK06_00600 [bacterium]|nr:hypothetical protein [bacterium]
MKQDLAALKEQLTRLPNSRELFEKISLMLIEMVRLEHLFKTRIGEGDYPGGPEQLALDWDLLLGLRLTESEYTEQLNAALDLEWRINDLEVKIQEREWQSLLVRTPIHPPVTIEA